MSKRVNIGKKSGNGVRKLEPTKQGERKKKKKKGMGG